MEVVRTWKEKRRTKVDNNGGVVIISWCWSAGNYGQILQAYALQSVLQHLGMNPITVSYLEKDKRKAKKKGTAYKEGIIEKCKFQHFILKYMNPVIQCATLNEVERVCKNYKIYICGSDQIWNPNYIKENKVYTLDFGGKAKRIAYAPSVGINGVSDKNMNVMADMAKKINKIDFLSVRETTAKEILERWVHKKVEVVLDPTLLVSRREWLKIASKRRCQESYVFVYIIGKIEVYQRLIRQIADKYQVEKIIWLNVIKNSSFNDERVKKVNTVTPEDFLSYINYASVIITDSFHGVMFSVKFQKDFFVLERKYQKRSLEKDSRIDDILERLDLKERKVRNINDVNQIELKINFKKVNLNYREERKRSLLFLKKALEGDIDE